MNAYNRPALSDGSSVSPSAPAPSATEVLRLRTDVSDRGRDAGQRERATIDLHAYVMSGAERRRFCFYSVLGSRCQAS
jgi:hypothetical protein